MGLLLTLPVVVRSESVSPQEIEVLDGDTIRDRGRIIRLVGFDAETQRARCESERSLGEQATARLRQLVAAGGVNLALVRCSCRPGTEGTRWCNRGRACGTLRVGGRDGGSILIAEGLAHPLVCRRYSCPPRQAWCK
jgi:endonuclease YncB( thermonuclease family)